MHYNKQEHAPAQGVQANPIRLTDFFIPEKLPGKAVWTSKYKVIWRHDARRKVWYLPGRKHFTCAPQVEIDLGGYKAVGEAPLWDRRG